MEYEDRVIAFIDILGFKNIIENKQPIEIKNYLNLLKEIKIRPLFSIYLDTFDQQVTYFSDCIVFSFKLTKEHNTVEFDIENIIYNHFISSIIGLQQLFIRDEQQLVRGAICIGK